MPDADKNGHIGRLVGKLNDIVEDKPHADAPISLGDLLEKLGERSFGPLLAIPALIIVSPASAIPAVPSVLAFLIGLVVAQVLLGRRSLWVPDILRRCALPAGQVARATKFLRALGARLDPLLGERLIWLTVRPASLLPLGLTLTITLIMPLIEFVPLLTSFAAGVIALFSLGLYLRDGLLILIGYGIAVGSVAAFAIAGQAIG